jgi:hypothetical protein
VTLPGIARGRSRGCAEKEWKTRGVRRCRSSEASRYADSAIVRCARCYDGPGYDGPGRGVRSTRWRSAQRQAAVGWRSHPITNDSSRWQSRVAAWSWGEPALPSPASPSDVIGIKHYVQLRGRRGRCAGISAGLAILRYSNVALSWVRGRPCRAAPARPSPAVWTATVRTTAADRSGHSGCTAGRMAVGRAIGAVSRQSCGGG